MMVPCRGALDQITYVVVGYAALVVLLAAYSAFRWRERPPWLDSMAWMLEFLLVVRALAGLGAMAAGDRPDSAATHVGYLRRLGLRRPDRALLGDRGPRAVVDRACSPSRSWPSP